MEQVHFVWSSFSEAIFFWENGKTKKQLTEKEEIFMKKLTAAFLVTVMCLGLTACAGQSEESAESEDTDAKTEE